MWVSQVALSLVFHIWLSGSVLLPCMLLVRWGAAKWKWLDRLASSRRLWLWIWGCYGFLEVILLAGLYLWRTFLWAGRITFVPFDVLGWAGAAVLGFLSTLQATPQHSGLGFVFVLALALKAVVEVAIDCCLAAVAWWVYGLLSRESAARRRIEMFTVCIWFSVCMLGVANSPHFWREVCFDCYAPHGIPFTYFHEGGLAGDSGFIWKGVVGNFMTALAAALLLFLVWLRTQLRRPEKTVSNLVY